MNSKKYPKESEIIYLEANVNYTVFHLSNGKQFVSCFTLKTHDSQLKQNGFLRVHKSYLLNPNYIENFNKDGKRGEVQLSNGKVLQVSRRKINTMKTLLRDYIK